MEKLNVAQIGVGYWGPNLLRNLTGNKNCIVKGTYVGNPAKKVLK